jgi:hypothetical protein
VGNCASQRNDDDNKYDIRDVSEERNDTFAFFVSFDRFSLFERVKAYVQATFLFKDKQKGNVVSIAESEIVLTISVINASKWLVRIGREECDNH